MKSGLLIAFEGIDGTGKSTQIPLLADYLRAKGYEVVETREPTDGPYGRKIRHLYVNRQSSSPKEELELFVQDRRQHVEEVIAPALAEGKIVLTDRYYFSTAAYQGATGMDPKAIFAANDFAPRPDLVLLLVMDPEESVRRIEQLRGEQLNDFEQVEQLRKVAELFATFSDDCILRVNAAASIDRVQAEIQRGVQQLIEKKR
ncbi:MAG TPA: dTMP kinase [Desulfobulbaceae bacterium]|nr:dTMP kinase [Desulfobulbaceae bacterium]